MKLYFCSAIILFSSLVSHASSYTSARFAAVSEVCSNLPHVVGATPLHVLLGDARLHGRAAAGCLVSEECVIFTCYPGRVNVGSLKVKCDPTTGRWSSAPLCLIPTTVGFQPAKTLPSLHKDTTTGPDPCEDSEDIKENFCWRPKDRWRFNAELHRCEKIKTCLRGPDNGGEATNIFLSDIDCRVMCYFRPRKQKTTSTTATTTTTMTTTTTTMTTSTKTTTTKAPEPYWKRFPIRIEGPDSSLTGGLHGPQCIKGVDKAVHSSCKLDSSKLLETIPVNAKKILDLHNSLRHKVDPPARFMPDLAWNFDLAISAERFAATCPSDINDSAKSRALPRWRHVGQNACHSISANMTFDDCISEIWAKEAENWKYGVGEVIPNTVVTHYSQMIWSGTLFVGCGMARCQNSTWTTSIICNYAPAGNYSPLGENPAARPYIRK